MRKHPGKPSCNQKSLYFLLLLLLLLLLFISLSSLPNSEVMQGLGRKGDTELFTCPAPCVSHPEWPLKISEGSLCFCCPGEMCSHSCFYQTMATFKFRGCSSPEWNSLSPEGVQKSGDLEPSSLLKFKASFQGHIPIYHDNPSWIWHMCINLNLSLFLY